MFIMEIVTSRQETVELDLSGGEMVSHPAFHEGNLGSTPWQPHYLKVLENICQSSLPHYMRINFNQPKPNRTIDCCV